MSDQVKYIDMPLITVPANIKTIDKIIIQKDCDLASGHCFGSQRGAGGEQEVWTLSSDKTQILVQEKYLRCQDCSKYVRVPPQEANPNA